MGQYWKAVNLDKHEFIGSHELGAGAMPALKQMSRMLTPPQAAEALGVSIHTVRFWIYRRKIDFVKIGRSVRVSEATVQKIIDRGTMPALEDRR